MFEGMIEFESGDEVIRVFIFFAGFFIGYYGRPYIDIVISRIFTVKK
jgi:hypothetical protein